MLSRNPSTMKETLRKDMKTTGDLISLTRLKNNELIIESPWRKPSTFQYQNLFIRYWFVGNIFFS